MTDRPAIRRNRTNWNLPPGQITTRCADCVGEGVVITERAYASGDEGGIVRVPAQCRSCRGRGSFPGMQPPV
ncbi:hypothetical protein BJF78_21025 [Pseudonocardia sp. CNS-139]|nr:hypothetical protein BJF78_21025 [Pseudonocardia sp. CNS-139]